MKISAITPNQYKGASRSNNTQNNAPQGAQPSFKKIVYVTTLEELKKLTKDAEVMYKEVGKLARAYDKKFKHMFEIKVQYQKWSQIITGNLEFRVQPRKQKQFLQAVADDTSFAWGLGTRKSLREAARRLPIKDYNNKYTKEFVERVTYIKNYEEKMCSTKMVPLFEKEYNVPNTIKEKYSKTVDFNDIVRDLEFKSPKIQSLADRKPKTLTDRFLDFILD